MKCKSRSKFGQIFRFDSRKKANLKADSEALVTLHLLAQLETKAIGTQLKQHPLEG